MSRYHQYSTINAETNKKQIPTIRIIGASGGSEARALESNKTLSNIKLYEDSILKDEGYQVEVKDSIFYHSFSEFIAIVGIIIGAIVTLVAVYLRRRGSAEKL